MEAICRSRPARPAFCRRRWRIGGGPVETMIVMEQIGRALLLEPYLATVVLGGGFIPLGGSKPADRALSEGRRGRTQSFLRPFRTPGALRPCRYCDYGAPRRCRLHTRRRQNAGAAWRHAEKFIVSARLAGAQTDRNGLALFLIDATAPGMSVRGYPTVDGLRAAEVTLTTCAPMPPLRSASLALPSR